MAVGLAHAGITLNVIKSNYEPDELWVILLLSVVMAVIARRALFSQLDSGAS